MISKETESLLVNLAKIETAIARIYEKFATNGNFTESAKKFWTSTMVDEFKHAKLFESILKKSKKDDSIRIEVNVDNAFLRNTIKELRKILKEVNEGEVSESRAYELGAFIEEGIFEFGFSRRITTDNKNLANNIKEVEEDTKRHHLLLHNFSLGEKSPLKSQPALDGTSAERKQ